jgi:transposase
MTSIPVMPPSTCPSWCASAKRSRLQPIKDVVDLVRRHWDGIIAWHHTHVSNGLLEGTNSLIQAAKARARGYRTKQKMITIAYLIAGNLPLPTVTNPNPG